MGVARHLPRGRALRTGPPSLLALALVLTAPAAPAESIVGVCPDGSVFIVQRADQVPCSQAKEVEAHEVPPLRPELLPRPFTWQVYRDSIDPDNPYNAIDAARKVRELQAGASPSGSDVGLPRGAPPVSAAPPPLARGGAGVAEREPAAAEALGLSDGELRDLFLIVELAQEAAPAAFVKEAAGGGERLRVSVAHSAAFQKRFDAVLPGGARPGSRALLFSAVAREAEAFFANFTFTQAHYAFQPDAGDPRELGLLYGRLGELDAGEAVLGYVVVPDHLDLHAPIGVYWNDRHATATFAP